MTRSSGFFSELSTALFDLARLGRRVQSINSDGALSWFKDHPTENLLFDIFDRRVGTMRGPKFLRSELHHHSVYCDLPFEEITPFISHWFTPSKKIRTLADGLSKSLGVSPGRMIAVNLRGSQKFLEVKPTPITHWVEVVSQFRIANPLCKVVLCSDDQDLVDQFVALADFEVLEIGQNLRTTRGNSITKLFRDSEGRSEESRRFVAQTWLISQAHILITHTGNTAYWTSLFRGCHCGLFQFTTNPGELAFSRSPCTRHKSSGDLAVPTPSSALVRYVEL